MLVLVGMLLFFPPLFVLGPLAGLLAASRPQTRREWAWIAAALLWIVVVGITPGGLARQAMYAWALCVTGSFVILMLTTRSRVINGALAAAALSVVLTTLLFWWLGISWGEVQFAIEQAAQSAWRAQSEAQAADYFGNLAEVQEAGYVAIKGVSQLLPAALSLAILPALAVAWTWYHRLAQQPNGAPSERFAEFRFSDQLIWGVVLGAIGMVASIPEPFDAVAGNVALLVGMLYLVRGLAVVWFRMEWMPAPLLLLLVMVAIMLFPVMLGAAFALGVADTWVDFRRRPAPADQTRE